MAATLEAVVLVTDLCLNTFYRAVRGYLFGRCVKRGLLQHDILDSKRQRKDSYVNFEELFYLEGGHNFKIALQSSLRDLERKRNCLFTFHKLSNASHAPMIYFKGTSFRK